MKKQLLDYSDEYWKDIDTTLSFGPFMAYLRQRAAEETGTKVQFYKTVLEAFEKAGLDDKAIPLEEVFDYEPFLEKMYACLTPVLQPEQEILWALWVPVKPILLYGTNAFYDLMLDHKIDLQNRTVEDYRRERLQMIYSSILKKFYHFHPRHN